MKSKYFQNFKQALHMIKPSLIATSMLCLGMAVSLFGSCATDDLTPSDQKNGDLVSFRTVMQEDATAGKTRTTAMPSSVTPGITAEDLQPTALIAKGSAGLGNFMVESTTVEGIDVQKAPTRDARGILIADVAASNVDFATVGYQYASAGTNFGTDQLWFQNEATQSNGQMRNNFYWSSEKPYASFFGIYPKTATDNNGLSMTENGLPAINFMVNRDVRNQVDLMTAYTGEVGPYSAGQTPTATMRFYHALTAVKFALGANFDKNLTITGVALSNVYKSGTYTLPLNPTSMGEWRGQDFKEYFEVIDLDFSTSENANTTFIDGENTFLMIPQTLPDDAAVTIFINYDQFIRLSLKGQVWKPGTTRTYKINQTQSNWTFTISQSETTTLGMDGGAATYQVESYQTANDGTRRAVPWQIAGFSTDGGTTWITDLNQVKDSQGDPILASASLMAGNGSVSAGTTEQGTLTLNPMGKNDYLAQLNDRLKTATPATGKDLSLNAAGQKSTANSYLISAPGSYKIPLVYGNALKNGTENPSSYQTSNTGSNILSKFKNAYDENITQPYINVDAHPATGAKLVWTDVEGIVSNYRVTGTGANAYLEFDVPANKIANGNAVLAVQDATGKTLWSWHLWFNEANALSTIDVNNGVNTYKMTRDALGQKWSEWYDTKLPLRKVLVKVGLRVKYTPERGA